MPTLCLVGNSPSSGSTLLADLLDSTKFTACGPELEIFSHEKFLVKNPQSSDLSGSYSKMIAPRATSSYLRTDRLKHYGLSQSDLEKLIDSANSFSEFSESFSIHYLDFRNKSKNGIVFEKTPQNLNNLHQFLEHSDGYFVHIVRNPVFVVRSLINRSWSMRSALATWMSYESKLMRFKGNERIISIKYEDLVQKPYETIQMLIQTINPGLKISLEEIRTGHQENRYRQKTSKRKDSWSTQSIQEIKNANDWSKIKPEFLKRLNGFKSSTLSSKYAKRYKLEPLTFQELLEEYGYSEEFNKRVSGLDGIQPPKYSMKDRKKFLTKWAKGFLKGELKLRDLPAHFNPLPK